MWSQARRTEESGSGRGIQWVSNLLAIVFATPSWLQDTHWSETGDRYMLKLFRDFVFHQVGDAVG